MTPWLCLPIGYAIGGIPTGIWISKRVAGRDPRDSGSGSSGATNVSRLLGKKWAIIVLILDALKGFFPVRLLAPMVAPEQTALAMTFMAAGCVLGHVWTPYAGFRGGKGVATAAGAWMALSTFAFAIVAAIWLLSFVVTRIVSISSLLAVVALPVVVAMIDSPSAPAFVFAVATALFIVYTHRGNLKRLRSGQEKPLV